METSEIAKTQEMKSHTSVSKVMLTAFFDPEGLLLVDLSLICTSLSVATGTHCMKQSRISNHCMLLCSVIQLHGSAHPHVANMVQDALPREGWDVLHHLASRPDLST